MANHMRTVNLRRPLRRLHRLTCLFQRFVLVRAHKFLRAYDRPITRQNLK